MARSVLKLGRWAAAAGLALGLLWGACAPAEAAPVVCSAGDAATITSLQQTVEAGVLYQEMVRRFGQPKQCAVKQEGTGTTLTFAFGHHAEMEARIDTAVEYSEQRVMFKGLNDDAALDLLKRAGAKFFGEDGCGVDWGKSADEPNTDKPEEHARVYQGTACNCKGRIEFRGKAVTGVALSTAC